jgi:trans-aconitate methyltransferase
MRKGLFVYLMIAALSFLCWSALSSVSENLGKDFCQFELGRLINQEEVKSVLLQGYGLAPAVRLLSENFPNAELSMFSSSSVLADKLAKKYRHNPQVAVFHKTLSDSYPEDQFDLAMSNYVLQWLPEAVVNDYFKEIYKTLKPSGIFIAKTMDFRLVPEFLQVVLETQQQSKYSNRLNGFTSRIEGHSLDAYIRLLLAAGFTVQKVTYKRTTLTFDSRDALSVYLKAYVSSYQHIAQQDPVLAEEYMNEIIDRSLEISGQRGQSTIYVPFPLVFMIATK